MKILVAGLGSAGQRHVRNLRAFAGDEVELLAFRQLGTSPLIGSDHSADPSADVGGVYRIRTFDDLDEALAETPDAAIVANPSHLHLPVALAAVNAGCHVFVEKPLSHTLEGIDELADAVRRRGVVCAIGYQLRFDSGFQLLERVAAEDLGRLIAARISYGEHLADWHPWEDYRRSYASRPDQGGGVLLAQIHDLDLAYALFGLPSRVFAVGGRRSSLDVEVEDVVELQLDVEGLPVQVHQDLVRRPPVRTYEVIGEDASVLWDQQLGTVTITRAESTDVHRFDHSRNDLFVAELRHFLASIEGAHEPLVDIETAAASLRIAVAAKESLATGNVVALR
jgi:predicted dehydrogenase